MKKTISLAFLAVLLVFGGNAQSATRDLVFEDEDESANAAASSGRQTLGVKTTVRLTRDGKTTIVSPNHEFKSGDKVKLAFTPNVDGYVYWLAKGTSGNYSMLYPSARAGMDNRVEKDREYTIPASGSFRFDDTPGNEELLCILSTEKLDDLDKAAAEQFKNASAQVAQMEEEHAQKRASRDLVFEDEDEENVNVKTQEGNKGEPFVAPYVLKHN